ncbi:MAG: hypothetical protein LBK99_05610 [Opitutaceae bacterium]|nr:hypothetical protein [Opitutaceae bacterium]
MTLTEHDFDTLKTENLRVFSERVGQLPADDGWLFGIEVSRLESQAFQLYGVAALMARNEDDLDKVASLWGTMERVCDAFATRLADMCKNRTSCQVTHDRLLDLRNKCSRLHQLHA